LPGYSALTFSGEATGGVWADQEAVAKPIVLVIAVEDLEQVVAER
jgi:hypothetical protein